MSDSEVENDKKLQELQERKKKYNRTYYEKVKAKRIIDGKKKVHCDSCKKDISKWSYANTQIVLQ